MNEGWQFVTVSALVINALLGFGYRLYRLPRGGTRADVNGQALLGVILIAMALLWASVRDGLAGPPSSTACRSESW